MLSTKEQLVLLVAQEVSYRHQWYYLRALYDQKLINQPLEIAQCQALYDQLIVNDYKLKPKAVDFNVLADPDDPIHQLVQHSIVYSDPIYPSLWKEIAKPPLVIFYQGVLDLLKRPLVSIVGTRKITSYGREVAALLTRELVQHGWVCVSGLANGTDGVCHQTAIDTNKQSTIAIISSGVDFVYPHYHKQMQYKIAKDHLLLSEYLPNKRPQRHHFVMRNRLVAGLTPVTIVIEAASKSGSLMTANYALQYNREVYALPGEITNPQAKGCNELIAIGATPIVSVEQLLDELFDLFQYQQQWRQ